MLGDAMAKCLVLDPQSGIQMPRESWACVYHCSKRSWNCGLEHALPSPSYGHCEVILLPICLLIASCVLQSMEEGEKGVGGKFPLTTVLCFLMYI